MALMPRNLPLAVAWRLLLVLAVATVILAVGIRQYQWRPFGEKQMPTEKTDDLGKVIQQEMGPEPPTPAPLEAIGSLLENALPSFETSPTPAPEPTAPPPEPKKDPKAEEPKKPAPTPTPKPKPKSDEKALEELLEEESDK
ncbi:MAG: hypothetical protein GX444_11720 [Myxococcales bacterium]|nr:hypothetical protein [Myxococcales bacterium]